MASARLPYLPGDPLEVLRRWPDDRPVLMLHSGRIHDRFARWSMLAQPAEWIVCEGLSGLSRVLERNRPGSSRNGSPFFPGWIAAFSYDLGRSCEPTAQHGGGARADPHWPDLHLARIDHALVFDHARGSWSTIGDASELFDSLDSSEITDEEFTTGELRSSFSREEYTVAVERILEYIRAGDVYQVNLARRLSAAFVGSARALARRALASSAPWYGAYLELPGNRTLISLSPELFLQIDAQNRRVTTRPIKGTVPASGSILDLQRSEKDAAELHMIVDLMRNDLGRICEIGSVLVKTSRIIETHLTVHHGVAEVEGILSDDATLEHILGATFPPGSVTGAPKIRAMQIIDELEPIRRGPYCGAIGHVGDAGNVMLNVAIRTIAIEGRCEPGRCGWFREGILNYGTGGGIVADSIPAREWEETEQKAVALRHALARRPSPRAYSVERRA